MKVKLKSIRNIKIKVKLLLLSAVSILGVVSMGLFSTLTTDKINQASTDITQKWLPMIVLAEELNTSTSDYRINEYYYVLTTDNRTKLSIEDRMSEISQKIENAFEDYAPYVAADRAMMDEAKMLWDRYLESSRAVLQISREGRTEEAVGMITGESRALFEEASKLFLEVVEYNKKEADAASLKGDILSARLARAKAITTIIVSVIVIVLIIYIMQAIEKPIEDLVEGTRRVSNGDLDVRLDYESEDEIGVLTNSVNSLIQRLRDIIDDEKYLFREIGGRNFEVKSNCEQAYRGDFAPILYAIESLKSRLEYLDKAKDSHIEVTASGRKKGKNGVINVSRKVDVTDKKR